MTRHAYIVSIEAPTSDRLQTLQARLSRHGFVVHLIEGVNGPDMRAADYFRQTLHWRKFKGHTMTPGELGCTRSHQQALRLAAAQGGPGHLILEDDFQASDAALEWIAQAGECVPPDTLLHLGGQEGMQRFFRYLRGVECTQCPGTVEIDRADLPFLSRTVAYVVDSQIAQAMVRLIDQGAYVIDDFAYAQARGAFQSIWFRWVVSHPLDLSSSGIEAERVAIDRQFFKARRSWSDMFYRRTMQCKLLWRIVTTPRSRFLIGQQPGNQLP